MFRFGCVSGGASLYGPQAKNNLVRVAYEAMASVLGGVQSMFTAAWDEPFALPSEESATLALRTQQILAYETGVASVADPLGGSYFVEALTDATEEKIIEIMHDLETHGGMVRAIEDGYLQGLIADEAFKIHQEVESGARPVVGVNRFVSDEPAPDVSMYELDAEGRDVQLKRLSKVKADRDSAAVAASLAALSARGRGNRQPDAQADRLRQRVLHGRGDGERPESGVGRVPAAGGVLMAEITPARSRTRPAYSSPSPASTAMTAAPRSSPARCATRGSRSSTPASDSASRTSCRSRCRRTSRSWG